MAMWAMAIQEYYIPQQTRTLSFSGLYFFHHLHTLEAALFKNTRLKINSSFALSRRIGRNTAYIIHIIKTRSNLHFTVK